MMLGIDRRTLSPVFIASACVAIAGCHLLLDDEPYSDGSTGTATTNVGGGGSGAGASGGGGAGNGGMSDGGTTNGGGGAGGSGGAVPSTAPCIGALATCEVPVGDTVVLHFDETCENGTWCSWNDLPDSFEIGAGDLMVRATDDTGWWTDDAGRDYPPYLYRRFTGDFAIVTQVRSLELGGNETLTQDFTVAGFVVRAATGSAPAHDASEATEHWLKFEWGRRGGDFSGLGYLIGQKPSTGGDANNLDGHNTPGATTRLLGLCRTGGDLTFIIDDGGILQFNPETPPEQFTSEIEVGLTSGNWNTNGFVTEAAFPGVAMRSGAITPNCQAVVEDLLAQLGR